MSRLFGSLVPDSRRLYVAMLANFALFGLTMTLVGATLPRLIRELGWSYTASGAVLASSAAGYVISTFTFGLLIHRLGRKRVVIAGLVLDAVGFLLFARSPSPGVNAALNFTIGVGLGCVEVVTNYSVIHLERQGESRLMNLAHAAFCVGGVVGPAFAGAYLRISETWGEAWRLLYSAAGVLAALSAAMFASLRFPPEPRPAAGGTEAPRGAAPLGHLRPLLLALFTLMLLLYVAAEIGFSNWTSEYFVTVLGTGGSVGASMVSLLWLGVLAGRLALSLWYRGQGQMGAVLLLSVASTLSVLLLRVTSSVAVAALAVGVTGLGYSGIYPMVMTLVGRWFRSARAVGIATTGGGIGSFVFPLLIGYFGERAGLRNSFLLCGAATLALAVLAAPVCVLRYRLPAATGPAATGRNTE